MTTPIWQTTAGDLGTIQEGQFYQIPLSATASGTTVYYRLLAGSLPAGIQVRINGSLEGFPEPISLAKGAPAEVGESITSKFTVRAYTLIGTSEVVDGVADRTFTLTVTGQDAPSFITPAGSVGKWLDASEVSIPIEFNDPDPEDVVTVSIAEGELPGGLTINSSTGVISGVIEPPLTATGLPLNKTYEFTVQISDGKTVVLRDFSIFVYNRDNLVPTPTDPAAVLTLENTIITEVRSPFLLNEAGEIGTFRHDNFFAYQFRGLEFDGDAYHFEIIADEGYGYDVAEYDETPFDDGDRILIPGLILNPQTGWYYGFLPDIGLTEETYTFKVRVVEDLDPSVTSEWKEFTITLIGDIEADITWNTPEGSTVQADDEYEDLGMLCAGVPSTLSINATTAGNEDLFYRFLQGSHSRLPMGLTLLPTGEIAGRPGFITFTLDGGSTTFDEQFSTRLEDLTTTFDRTFLFTVEAYTLDGSVSVLRNFKLTLCLIDKMPWENLYVDAMPPEDDRAFIAGMLSDTTVIPPEAVYRPTDPLFGITDRVRYYHAYGLAPGTVEDYIAAFSEYHYRKLLTLGDIRTAQALDDDGNVLYEVIYSHIVDDVADAEERVRLSAEPVVDSLPVIFGHVNSLNNMRNQVIRNIGQIVPGLPLWMTSKQADGRVLGFTPAWVIAHVKPGTSAEIAYRMRLAYEGLLNRVDFEVDRFTVDKELTYLWGAPCEVPDIPPPIIILPEEVGKPVNEYPVDSGHLFFGEDVLARSSAPTMLSMPEVLASLELSAWLAGPAILAGPEITIESDIIGVRMAAATMLDAPAVVGDTTPITAALAVTATPQLLSGCADVVMLNANVTLHPGDPTPGNHTYEWTLIAGDPVTWLEPQDQISTSFEYPDAFRTDRTFRFTVDAGTGSELSVDVLVTAIPTETIKNLPMQTITTNLNTEVTNLRQSAESTAKTGVTSGLSTPGARIEWDPPVLAADVTGYFIETWNTVTEQWDTLTASLDSNRYDVATNGTYRVTPLYGWTKDRWWQVGTPKTISVHLAGDESILVSEKPLNTLDVMSVDVVVQFPEILILDESNEPNLNVSGAHLETTMVLSPPELIAASDDGDENIKAPHVTTTTFTITFQPISGGSLG